MIKDYGLTPIERTVPALLHERDLELTRGQLLRILLYVHGFTGSEMAKSIGYHVSHLSNVINERDPLNDKMLEAVAGFLEVVPQRLQIFSPEYYSRRKKKWMTKSQIELETTIF